jgi:hypothetical protein
MAVFFFQQTQSHVALVIDRCRIRKFVGREGDSSFRPIAIVSEGTKNFLIKWTALIVDQSLFTPPETVANETIGHMQTILLLLIYVDYQFKGIAYLNTVREFLASKNLHMARRHWNFVG